MPEARCLFEHLFRSEHELLPASGGFKRSHRTDPLRAEFLASCLFCPSVTCSAPESAPTAPEQPPSPVSINLSAGTMTLEIGESASLTALVTGGPATASGPLGWTSSDPAVARVNSSG